jgi:hypothetical protein
MEYINLSERRFQDIYEIHFIVVSKLIIRLRCETPDNISRHVPANARFSVIQDIYMNLKTHIVYHALSTLYSGC